MLDKAMLYQILYALMARDNREGALFGPGAPHALEAFERSLAGEAFPELWFEVPLAGDPWFDVHVLTAREGLDPGNLFVADAEPFYPKLFEWFAQQDDRVRQLALSYDIGSLGAQEPAVQLLVRTDDSSVPAAFIQEAGGADAASAYLAFVEGLPQSWFPCYSGIFPERPGLGVRVECIPDYETQQAYASDASLLRAHLQQAGLPGIDDELVARCQLLARTPFQLEFQFNVQDGGAVSPTLGASLRFAPPSGWDKYQPFQVDGPAGVLMQQVESWGLADGRWRLLEAAAFAQNASFKGESVLLYGYPAFVKLRWSQGKPLDAKAYLIAGVQLA